MKALSNNVVLYKAEKLAKEEFYRLYNEEKYKMFKELSTDIVRQTIAMILYGMKLRGADADEIHKIFDGAVCALEMPEHFLGKTITCQGCMEFISKNYGIDFERIAPNIQSKEDFLK